MISKAGIIVAMSSTTSSALLVPATQPCYGCQGRGHGASRLALIRACTIHPLLSALAEYLAVLKFPPATFYCPGNICGFGDRRTAGIVSALWCMTLSARLLETSYRLVLEDSAPIPDIAT